MAFSPPAAPGEAGTFGLSSELLAVEDGAWGNEFTGVAWYRGAPGGGNPVLLEVAYADEASGDLRPSATWRLNGFSDNAQG